MNTSHLLEKLKRKDDYDPEEDYYGNFHSRASKLCSENFSNADSQRQSNEIDSESRISSQETAMRNAAMKQEPFVVKVFRRNIVVELDKTFIDVMILQEYLNLLPIGYRQELEQVFNSGTRTSKHLQKVTFEGMDFMIAIRKGTEVFFKKLSKKYTLHVVSYMQKDFT